jgi:hypothetical protein
MLQAKFTESLIFGRSISLKNFTEIMSHNQPISMCINQNCKWEKILSTLINACTCDNYLSHPRVYNFFVLFLTTLYVQAFVIFEINDYLKFLTNKMKKKKNPLNYNEV